MRPQDIKQPRRPNILLILIVNFVILVALASLIGSVAVNLN